MPHGLGEFDGLRAVAIFIGAEIVEIIRHGVKERAVFALPPARTYGAAQLANPRDIALHAIQRRLGLHFARMGARAKLNQGVHAPSAFVIYEVLAVAPDSFDSRFARAM